MSDDTAQGDGVRDDQARGDDVYQPEYSDVGNRPSDDLDLENVIGERGLDEMMTEGYSPPDRPLAVDRYGTTGEEQQEGETLDQRIAQEMPDLPQPLGDGLADLTGGAGERIAEAAEEAEETEIAEEAEEENENTEYADGTRAGRLTAVDDWAPRRPSDMVARDVGVDGGAASAEEAAMHVVYGDELPEGEEEPADDMGPGAGRE